MTPPSRPRPTATSTASASGRARRSPRRRRARFSVLPALGDTLLSVAADEFDGRWVRIDHGPGLGQTRKIVDATQDGAGVHLTVSPPFGVTPVVGESRIIVSQQAWQMYLVDNSVDNQCSQGLADYTLLHWNGGTLGFFGSAADSVIDSNEQQHTAGILVSSQYVADDSFTLAPYQSSQYFIDVRGNSIVGSFGGTGGQVNAQNKTGSGILLLGQIVHYNANHAIVPTDDHLGFGVSVSHNLLRDAALTEPVASNHVWALGAATGGAPEGEALMPAYDDTLIYRDQVSNVPAPWYPVPAWMMWPAGEQPGDLQRAVDPVEGRLRSRLSPQYDRLRQHAADRCGDRRLPGHADQLADRVPVSQGIGN